MSLRQLGKRTDILGDRWKKGPDIIGNFYFFKFPILQHGVGGFPGVKLCRDDAGLPDKNHPYEPESWSNSCFSLPPQVTG